MNKRIGILIGFILVSLFQLIVPAKMIIDKEKILEKGIEFKFKVAPIDPNDPFRGKYIILNFKENEFEVTEDLEWYRGDVVFVLLENDSDGFAKIKSVSKTPPINNKAFVQVSIQSKLFNKNKLIIKYPFNRFYMEESKAPKAEAQYRELTKDNKKEAYALVYINNGDAVLKDLIIEGISIKDLVK